MPLHNYAFWLCLFFLVGVFIASVTSGTLILIFLASVGSVYCVYKKQYAYTVLVLMIVAGGMYYRLFDRVHALGIHLPFGEKTEIEGIVRRVESRSESQKLDLETRAPYSGTIRVVARRYPTIEYGNLLKVQGVIQELPEQSKAFFEKEGLDGILNFPKIEIIGSGYGNPILARLLQFKQTIITVFQNVLPAEAAAFLGGLTLGDRQDFSKEFQTQLSRSGTTHLVALSGYNIAVIAAVVASIFGKFFSQTITFYLSTGMIVLFTLMTGASASVVRAAIMGIILLLAQQAERQYSMRNAIVLAACGMIFFNPKLLVFDLGFQLSFLALIGIVYLAPALQHLFRMPDAGIQSWQGNFLMTLAAQLAVLPLLVINFGMFSVTSFLANMLVLGTVPLTMALGFIVGGIGLFSLFLAKIISIPVYLLLLYQLWIIRLFSHFAVMVTIPYVHVSLVVTYYVGMLFLIHKFYAPRLFRVVGRV